jgi:hypothetical protein
MSGRCHRHARCGDALTGDLEAFCVCSHFYWRRMTRNALPLTVRHFHPRTSQANRKPYETLKVDGDVPLSRVTARRVSV